MLGVKMVEALGQHQHRILRRACLGRSRTCESSEVMPRTRTRVSVVHVLVFAVRVLSRALVLDDE